MEVQKLKTQLFRGLVVIDQHRYRDPAIPDAQHPMKGGEPLLQQHISLGDPPRSACHGMGMGRTRTRANLDTRVDSPFVSKHAHTTPACSLAGIRFWPAS